MLLRQTSGQANALKLFLYRNEVQLTTNDAIYSDGARYEPAVAVADHLSIFLPGAERVLVLGGGMGSMVQVMQKKGYDAHYTLVEKDKLILQWAMELFEQYPKLRLEPVCADAFAYMDHNTATYDLVFVDIFNGRVVPDPVMTEHFLLQCSRCLEPGGHFAVNYIINYKPDWEKVKALFTKLFPAHKVLELGINRVIVV